ncbi:hypothetical protein FCM35_KLT01529 [Carex littledalei]|uniref:Uncharacterized protein n=1 Tax=Carex littledalei TaxID=544730 RepID=A0A833VSX0_9POAL|nr:hypothetical protein FCM35_KLT01529 [Carex littledalei]
MEALRLAQLQYRLEMFQRVYWGLEPAIKLEFDGIFVIDSKKKKSNMDKRENKQPSRNICDGDFHQKMIIPDDDISDDSLDGILKPGFLDEGEPNFDFFFLYDKPEGMH